MKLSYLVSLSTAIAIFTGCGSSGSSNDTTSTTVNGQFIDSAVQGLDYVCSSGATGVTNALGSFTCNTGDTVTFSINGFEIGSVNAQETVTPKTLYPNDNVAMTNIAQLLQTLDSDNNPNNGITIDTQSTEVQALSGAVVSLNQVDFDSVMTSYIGKVLVDEATALAHLDVTIVNSQNSATLTALSSVYIFNGTTDSFCAAQNPYDNTYDGYTDFIDFVNAGGSSTVSYSEGSQDCSAYSQAGLCLPQDLSVQIGGTGSCIQIVTFPESNTTGGTTDDGSTPADEISFSDYSTVYKPMMPNLRSDNVYFSGIYNGQIDVEYLRMVAQPKISDILYFIGGNPAYGYEVYTDTYTTTTLNTQFYDSQTNFLNNEGDWNIVIIDNVHTKDAETKSTKFSKPIAADTLHQMYLELGLNITFDGNDKGQFMLILDLDTNGTDSSAYSYVSLGLNESAYLKVVAAFSN